MSDACDILRALAYEFTFAIRKTKDTVLQMLALAIVSLGQSLPLSTGPAPPPDGIRKAEYGDHSPQPVVFHPLCFQISGFIILSSMTPVLKAQRAKARTEIGIGPMLASMALTQTGALTMRREREDSFRKERQ